MSEEDTQAAKEYAARSGTQAKNAVKNAGRAAKHATVAGAEKAADVGEDFYDAAKERGPEVVEGARVAADATQREARRVSPIGLAHLTGDLGQGFMALAVALWAGTISYNKFAAAYRAREYVIRGRR